MGKGYSINDPDMPYDDLEKFRKYQKNFLDALLGLFYTIDEIRIHIRGSNGLTKDEITSLLSQMEDIEKLVANYDIAKAVDDLDYLLGYIQEKLNI